MKRYPPSERKLRRATQDGDFARANLLTRLLPISAALVTIFSTLAPLTTAARSLAQSCFCAQTPPVSLLQDFVFLLFCPLLVAHSTAFVFALLQRGGVFWTRSKTSLSWSAKLVLILPSMMLLLGTCIVVLHTVLVGVPQEKGFEVIRNVIFFWFLLACSCGALEWALAAWFRYQHYRRSEAEFRQDWREEQAKSPQTHGSLTETP